MIHLLSRSFRKKLKNKIIIPAREIYNVDEWIRLFCKPIPDRSSEYAKETTAPARKTSKDREYNGGAMLKL